jgi:hypothetical protein
VYRLASPNALFQGDIIVVPKATLTPDPKIITTGPLVCDACQAEVPMPGAVVCGTCGNSTPPQRPRRLTQYSQRYTRQETLFEKDREDAAITVEPTPVLVLSHSCDIDCKPAIKVAPVYPLTKFKRDSDQEKIRAGTGHMSYFYLAASDRIPECMANLDQVFYVEVKTLGEQKSFTSATEGTTPALVPFVEVIDDRLASLDQNRISDLYLRLTWLMARPDPESEVRFEPSESVFYIDPDRPKTEERPERGWRWPLPEWVRTYKKSDSE